MSIRDNDRSTQTPQVLSVRTIEGEYLPCVAISDYLELKTRHTDVLNRLDQLHNFLDETGLGNQFDIWREKLE